jgi:hypothetical protein
VTHCIPELGELIFTLFRRGLLLPAGIHADGSFYTSFFTSGGDFHHTNRSLGHGHH